MALFLVKFLLGLSVFCAAAWVFLVFTARLLAWILSQTVGVSITFQVGGCNCLKDVFVTFKKGTIESILIGEIKLSLRESLVNQGLKIFSRNLKLQLSMADLEVYLKSSAPGTKKKKPRSPSQSSRSLGQGTWKSLAYIARILSLVITDLNVKWPKSAARVRGLRVDASVHGESNPTFNLILQLSHFLFDISHSELGFYQSSSFSVERPAHSASVETKPPFMFKDLSVICEVANKREHGVKFENLDVSFGGIAINMREDLVAKTKVESKSSPGVDGSKDDQLIKESEHSKSSQSSVQKNIVAFPDKVSFNIRELDATFRHQGQDILANNTVTGIVLRTTKTMAYDDTGEATSHFSLSLDFSKLCLLREGTTSVMEFLEVAVIVTADVPMQLLPITVEVDVKLGSTGCNIIIGRLRPLLSLKPVKQKPMVIREESSKKEKKPTDHKNTIIWRCSLSASEMILMVYNPDDCLQFHGYLQSSHCNANNIASKKLELHAQLGEFHLNTADAYQQYLEKILTGEEMNSGSLVHIERLNIDCGHSETESHGEQDLKPLKLALSVDMPGMALSFGFKHVEALIKIMLSCKELLKVLSPSSQKTAKDKVGQSSKKGTGEGINILKLKLQRFSVKYLGETSLDDMTVADPKRVNFGSQGGQVIISVTADGKPREASITSSRPNGCQYLKFSTSLDILHLRFVFNKEKKSTQVEVDRTQLLYSEYTENQNSGTKVRLLDMQKAKFVHRSGGLNDAALCSLLNVTDISVRWEPDVHLALHEFATHLKFLLSNPKHHGSDHQSKEESVDTLPHREITSDQVSEKQHKKRDSVFAIDVEKLKVSAGVADGVETMIHVQSIFSENAKIGILFEEVMLAFNEAKIFRSSRLQVSRVPVSAIQNVQDSKSQMATTWDWVIRSPDICICMPYRLQLRAIDDAVEDTLRCLKLISAAKANIISPGKKSGAKKSKSGSDFGSVRLIIRKITADIEEEPLQGWVDEHFELMKKEVCAAVVRLKFLDELQPSMLSSSDDPNTLSSDKKIHYQGTEIDGCDASSVELLRTEIHKKVFRSYYEACQKIIIAEGSGAIEGFQSGFKPSINRASLMSVCATELDVTLTKIDKGSDGMIEFIKGIDPVSTEKNIPFSRCYGSDFVLNAESLVVKIRDYTYPLFSANSAKCQGRVVLAQQATSFQPQILHDVFVGRWWRVRMLRSASGTTPPNKVYLDLPISFQKGEVSFGVGYEPVFADISYAFTVALRRANLGTRSCSDQLGYATQSLASSLEPKPPQKERSLPWWDEIRNYVHGKVNLSFVETRWFVLGTTSPYEKLDKAEAVTGNMEIHQRDGYVSLFAKEFKVYLSSLESLMDSGSLKPPLPLSGPFLTSSTFLVEVWMDWGCESGSPLNHYLYSLPIEGKPRSNIYDPFRSTALSLRWNFSMNNSQLTDNQLASSSDMAQNTKSDGCKSSQMMGVKSIDSPTVNLTAHDLAWLAKFWNLNYLPPHKLRTFSRWPRFGVPRIVRSGNLSLDRVMTEFFLRFDTTPLCIVHKSLRDNDPANGIILKMARLKYENCLSRGKQEFTFDCRREPLDLVYQGVDIHMLKVYVEQKNEAPATQDKKKAKKSSRSEPLDKFGDGKSNYDCNDKRQDGGFFLLSDYFTVRRQTSKADTTRLLAWQEHFKKDLEMTYAISDAEKGNENDHTRSDLIDDDGFTVMIADNCQRVFVYGLKILWTLENRNAILSLVGGLSKAFEPPKPSPSMLYAQRKLLERQQITAETDVPHDAASSTTPNTSVAPNTPVAPTNTSVAPKTPHESSTPEENITSEGQDSTNSVVPTSETAKQFNDATEEGTCHLMVNVIQPQFNLHSEEAKGRFLLAAASGRVLARSFHSVVHVGRDIVEQAFNTTNVVIPDTVPEVTWKRMDVSVMLEHVQAHVAPTDIDPGAGIQWLPKIIRDSPSVKRTGPLLERVFMPCQMYLQYTQYKGGTPELKVKPLKELNFNSPDITSEMTSRQFRVMLDVLTNLLFARTPKLPKSSQDNEDTEEEIDILVPDGVEEVDLAKINLERRRRERKLLLSDIKTLAVTTDVSDGPNLSPENFDLWMVTGGKSTLIQELKKQQGNIRKAIKDASSELRLVMQEAAQIRLMEKEKNKSPSCAIRISVKISKVVWSMLIDDKPFAEAEINDMFYDFDRDYKDIGIALFTSKSFVIRNCVPNAKSDMLLSPWNAPADWGKRVMIHVNAKQGAPKDGKSAIEYFQVEIYPLRIHLTETMYTMMWRYIFPEDDQDSLKRQEVWKVSTTAGTKRGKKGSETAASNSQLEAPGKSTAKASKSGLDIFGEAFQMRKTQANTASGSNPELRRTSSFGKTWEETVADSVANELVLQAQSGLLNTEDSKNKSKDSKALKSGQMSSEDKKVGKSNDDKRARPRKMQEFHNIKISQVELLVTYEGSRITFSDFRLLMDTFQRDEFTGTWKRLFARVKKHIVWGVLKSVAGMQVKKFKDKNQKEKELLPKTIPENIPNNSDSDGEQGGKGDQFPTPFPKRGNDGAGDGFVTSIRGLFSNQRKKAKAYVLRTMRGEGEQEHGEWSDGDAEFSPFARQLTIAKTKNLIRRHSKKFSSAAPTDSENNEENNEENKEDNNEDNNEETNQDPSSLSVAILEYECDFSSDSSGDNE